MRLKIAIAVHGRFHAFDYARELLRRGHDVTLLTNYPKFAAGRFGVPAEHVRSFWGHGALGRLVWRLHQKGVAPYPEASLHRSFGRWAASRITKEDWDVVLCWSGVGEETFRALEGGRALRICERGSAHIRTQARLLEEEEGRTGIPLVRPSPWTIARELREYEMADAVEVISTFAQQSFLMEGVAPEKVELLLHGVDTRAFRLPPEAIEARCQRILSGEPLRVLNAGTFSLRKGMWDMASIIETLRAQRFRFRFVGPVQSEASSLVSGLRPLAEFVPKQPQEQLPVHYAWADLFILPTIEDGYGGVLAQASAAGLPVLTTPNGAGTDLVREGENGWVLPIRSPEAFVERLRWCDAHREELAMMARRTHEQCRPRDWADVAVDFEALRGARLVRHAGKGTANVR